MEALYLVNKSPRYAGKTKEYQLGFWDKNQNVWELDDSVGEHLITLLRDLGWGDVDTGDFPDLEIVTK